ncbi:hypothetical protein J6590_106845 [Homalodisca vitripennis]|nr:hypothetical protein J6590_106845 [Homalodisca vitripennis]
MVNSEHLDNIFQSSHRPKSMGRPDFCQILRRYISAVSRTGYRRELWLAKRLNISVTIEWFTFRSETAYTLRLVILQCRVAREQRYISAVSRTGYRRELWPAKRLNISVIIEWFTFRSETAYTLRLVILQCRVAREQRNISAVSRTGYRRELWLAKRLNISVITEWFTFRSETAYTLRLVILQCRAAHE